MTTEKGFFNSCISINARTLKLKNSVIKPPNNNSNNNNNNNNNNLLLTERYSQTQIHSASM